jgi:hypothetical protein
MNSISLLRFKILDKKKDNTVNEIEKCLEVLILLTGHEETNKIKSDLYQQLTIDKALEPKYLRIWSR